MSGRFIAVVGPSGVGKDTVIAALCQKRAEIGWVTRVITAAPQDRGEVFEPVTPERFAAMQDSGEFALSWTAHGLRYGIPAMAKRRCDAGQDMIANLSRGALNEVAALFADLQVLHITTRPEELRRRLAQRGRESPAEIAARLARPAPALPQGLQVIEIDNSGPVEDTVAAIEDALFTQKGLR